MEDIKSDYSFIETPGLQELEAKLSARIKDLCERNEHLTQRNSELRESAEVGWNAGVHLKKFEMIEADLKEEIKLLNAEREAQALEIKNKNGQISLLKSEVTGLRDSMETHNAGRDIQAACP